MSSGWCTAYTDASFGNGQASWAVRLRYDKPPFVVERAGKCAASDSFAAEFTAIVVAVALARETWPELKGVGVMTDCKGLVTVAKYQARWHRKKSLRQLQKALVKVAGPCRWRIRWVKAHQRAKTKQAWSNNRVDKLAKRARKN